MTLQKKYIIFGMIGCLCFGIGDWLLGYVDPAPVEGDIFYFIRAGHGAGYHLSKVAFTLALAMAGMCFLYPGFVHISDIANDEKTKRSLGYVFGLCSAGWMTLHILVCINIIVFSQTEKHGGRELAVTLSGSLGNVGMAALCCVFLFVGVPLIKLSLDILRQRTYLKKSSVFFTPIVPMGIIFVIAQILPQSPFSYGLYTFCMNGGMLVWFMYLLIVNRKGAETKGGKQTMEKVQMQGVPETMLQTLYARAAYSKKSDAKFYDGMAEKIVSYMDYDFSLAGKDAIMSKGVIARTVLLDCMVGDFIRENPKGTVVNIACGMDTRVYRLKTPPSVRWYNLDLPETIEVRRRFLTEDGHISVIAKSAMDESWAEEIEEPEGRTLVILEGLVMYLSREDVKQILSIISGRFRQAEVIMETMNPWVVNNMKEKSIEATNARFTWGIRSGKELEDISPEYTWIRDVSLVEGMKVIMPVYHLFGWIPAVRNISNKLVVLVRKQEKVK